MVVCQIGSCCNLTLVVLNNVGTCYTFPNCVELIWKLVVISCYIFSGVDLNLSVFATCSTPAPEFVAFSCKSTLLCCESDNLLVYKDWCCCYVAALSAVWLVGDSCCNSCISTCLDVLSDKCYLTVLYIIRCDLETSVWIVDNLCTITIDCPSNEGIS